MTLEMYEKAIKNYLKSNRSKECSTLYVHSDTHAITTQRVCLSKRRNMDWLMYVLFFFILIACILSLVQLVTFSLILSLSLSHSPHHMLSSVYFFFVPLRVQQMLPVYIKFMIISLCMYVCVCMWKYRFLSFFSFWFVFIFVVVVVAVVFLCMLNMYVEWWKENWNQWNDNEKERGSEWEHMGECVALTAS